MAGLHVRRTAIGDGHAPVRVPASVLPLLSGARHAAALRHHLRCLSQGTLLLLLNPQCSRGD